MKLVLCTLVFFSFYIKTSFTREREATNPLFLTPLIEDGELRRARHVSKVRIEGMLEIESYSGYLTVDKQFNSNMFFWFFPSQTDRYNDPVILWLQGGPGASDCIGVFCLNGPFIVTNELTLQLRNYTWIKNHSVLYIDNPVGTGYSFTNANGYSQNQTAIGENVYNALLQFFQMFPELQKNDFFVSGLGYGGKFTAAVSYAIHKNNPNAPQKINLKGLTIENGWIGPVYQQDYGLYLLETGLIDINGKIIVDQYESVVVNQINSGEWLEAFESFDSFIGGYLKSFTTFNNLTGYDSYYNILYPAFPTECFNNTDKYVEKSDFKKAIHVGNNVYHKDNTVVINLISDYMQSVVPLLSELACYYPVLFYTGQLDIIVNYPAILNLMHNFPFCNSNDFITAPRIRWYVQGRLAGYYKMAGYVTNLVVLDAGHLTAYEQPEYVLDLITKFTRNESLA